MTSDKRAKNEMSKRDFLKAALGGLGGVCLLGLSGCQGEQPSSASRSIPANAGEGNLAASHPAAWFESLPGNALRCRLCPRECRLQAGVRGP